MASPVLQIHEYESIPYTDLPPNGVDALEALSANVNGRILSFGRRAVRAQCFVGLLKTPAVTLEVLPKVHSNTEANLGVLMALLRTTGTATLAESGIAGLRQMDGSFLQVWIRHFAEQLHPLLHRQFQRAYADTETRTPFIRGRLRVEAMRTERAAHTGRYPCRYAAYTADHRLNQVLKRTCRILHAEAKDPYSASLLRRCLARLDDVTDRAVTVEMVDRITLTRQTDAYAPVLNLCRLVLQHATTGLRSGAVHQLAVVFNMNRLFESAVAALLRTHRSTLRIGGRPLTRIYTQQSLGRAYGQVSMNVDLVLEDDQGGRTLIDTKYKRRRAGDSILRNDVYQMHAYATAGTRRCDRIVLLYPGTAPPSRHPGTGPTLHARSLSLRALHRPGTDTLRPSAVQRALQSVLDF